MVIIVFIDVYFSANLFPCSYEIDIHLINWNSTFIPEAYESQDYVGSGCRGMVMDVQNKDALQGTHSVDAHDHHQVNCCKDKHTIC